MIFPATKKGAILTKKQFSGPRKSLVNSRPQRIIPPCARLKKMRRDKLLFSLKKTCGPPLQKNGGKSGLFTWK
ncbi:hypothetical protein [Chromobacterium phragmitis]|uniref:hypothetical protein n=2 Tax=Chromobacterium phragmitis TaxID=2202141 RepID=UPI0011AEA090|nr:hypothetical protein [Chromobacterium phragmitis]